MPTRTRNRSRRRAEIGFEMTDFDLTPIAAALKAGYEKYGAEGAAYNPQLKFDFYCRLEIHQHDL